MADQETRAEWDRQATRYRDLPPEIIEALEAIQPYQAQIPDWNSLSTLHNLARIDRHRTPHGLGLYLARLRLGVEPDLIEVVNAGRPGSSTKATRSFVCVSRSQRSQ
jgi:hypothetical protein